MKDANTAILLLLGLTAILAVSSLGQKRKPPKPPTGGAATASQLPWVLPRLLMTLGLACCGIGLGLLGLKFWGLIAAGVVFCAIVESRRWRGSGTSGGTARFCDEEDLRRAGALSGFGLIIGRVHSSGRRGSRKQALSRLLVLPWSKSREACLEFVAAFGRTPGLGQIIRLPSVTHGILVGGTGSGKGVSIILPLLLSHFLGSLVAFDTKGDLAKITAKPRARAGHSIVILSPFGNGTHTYNPLDAVENGPMLVDEVRALSEALVVRGAETDSHWNDSAVNMITAITTYVCLTFTGTDRSLNSVRDIANDPDMIVAVSKLLGRMGGVPGCLGNQIKFLFERTQGEKGQRMTLTREGASVASTVSRHLAFLTSEMVAKCLAKSTFDPAALLKPGTTVYLQIPPDQLVAQRGLLRLFVASLVRYIGRHGDEKKNQVLFLLDEASALNGLSPLQEVLVRGRSAGVRLLLAYQGDSQVRNAFKDEPSLLYENCSTQIYLGASSYETAVRISEMLGEFTNVVENYQTNTSRSRPAAHGGHGEGGQVSTGSNRSWAEQPRNLLKPAEILQLPKSLMLVFTPDAPPILCRRILYYSDPYFAGGGGAGGALSKAWGLALLCLLAGGASIAAAAAMLGSLGYVR